MGIFTKIHQNSEIGHRGESLEITHWTAGDSPEKPAFKPSGSGLLGSYGFELTGRWSRLRVFVVRLLGSVGAPPSPNSSLGRRSWRIKSSRVQRAASGPFRIESHLTDPLFPTTLSLGSLPLSPGLSLTHAQSLSFGEEKKKEKK
jgi:hypothetical protein